MANKILACPKALFTRVCSLTSCLSRREDHFRAEYLRQNSHSQFVDVCSRAITVKIMPVLQDNYMYMVVDPVSQIAAAIDPVEPDLILSEVAKHKLKLKKAFITHHHEDHAAGNELFEEYFPHTKIIAGDKRIPCVGRYIKTNETFELGSLIVHCLHTPCHTTGHYCFYVKPCNGDEGVLFAGDTLFQAGVGPFMEGTAEEMYKNIQLFYTLPEGTKVFGGHENTVTNLRFGLCIEPTNFHMRSRLEWAKDRRSQCLPTPPSTLCEEMLWNPFMRVTCPQVLEYTSDVDPVKAMAVLRKERDNFK